MAEGASAWPCRGQGRCMCQDASSASPALHPRTPARQAPSPTSGPQALLQHHHPTRQPALPPEGPLPSLSCVGAGWQGAPGLEPWSGDTRLPEGGADLEAEEAHSSTPPASARAEPVARLPPHIRSSEPAGLGAGLLRWRQPRSGPGDGGAAGRQAGWEDPARECGPGQTRLQAEGHPPSGVRQSLLQNALLGARLPQRGPPGFVSCLKKQVLTHIHQVRMPLPHHRPVCGVFTLGAQVTLPPSAPDRPRLAQTTTGVSRHTLPGSRPACGSQSVRHPP